MINFFCFCLYFYVFVKPAYTLSNYLIQLFDSIHSDKKACRIFPPGFTVKFHNETMYKFLLSGKNIRRLVDFRKESLKNYNFSWILEPGKKYNFLNNYFAMKSSIPYDYVQKSLQVKTKNALHLVMVRL